ncbi:MAG: CsgG/HfaB family protein [Myxococcota bacterium]|nr:CsgG/HfaB family protein [Myxococcota bacterium]
MKTPSPFLRLFIAPALLLSFVTVGCAITEGSRTIEPRVATIPAAPAGTQQRNLSIGKFANKTQFGQGLFSDGSDTLGLQGRQILKSHLSDSARFVLLDRANLQELAQETNLSGDTGSVQGAELLITGAVTEFGRKEVGAAAFWGLFGSTKTQVAYGKVSLSVVDVKTSAVLYTAQGAGETTLTTQQVSGFGSAASYDASLTDKVLNLALLEAVSDLVTSLDAGTWGRQ